MKLSRKLLSVFLSLLLVLGTFAAFPATVTAATQQDAVNWARAQNGEYWDLDEGPVGTGWYQCSDFVSAYINYVINNDPCNYYLLNGVRVTHAKWYPNQHLYPAGWQVLIFAEPGNAAYYTNRGIPATDVPQPGDIFVSSRYGSFGHVVLLWTITAAAQKRRPLLNRT